jgi:hypothetical protein
MPGLVPGIHVLVARGSKDVDGRAEPGHDGEGAITPAAAGRRFSSRRAMSNALSPPRRKLLVDRRPGILFCRRLVGIIESWWQQALTRSAVRDRDDAPALWNLIKVYEILAMKGACVRHGLLVTFGLGIAKRRPLVRLVELDCRSGSALLHYLEASALVLRFGPAQSTCCPVSSGR